ncbi:MAG: DUF5677 domain-containing protein [Treponema sp.]|nr:DUF5677 domain-containing protein [Treponema sp.]
MNDNMFDNPFYDVMNDSNNYSCFNRTKLKLILRDWKYDLGHDDSGHITNEDAQNEINKIFKSISFDFSSSISHFLKSKFTSEKNNCWNNLFISSMTLFQMCEAVYNYLKEKSKNENDILKKVLLGLTFNLLNNCKGLLYSFLSNDFLTVFQKNRILYECYVVYMFIEKHPELADDFYGYEDIIKYQIVKSTKDNVSKRDSIKIIKELEINYEENKGKNNGNFGWTSKVIKDRNDRKFETIVKDLNLDEKLEVMYRISSNFIHSNPYSAFIQPDIGFAELSLRFSTDVLVNLFVHFTELFCEDKRHKMLIKALLNLSKDVYFQEFDKSL